MSEYHLDLHVVTDDEPIQVNIHAVDSLSVDLAVTTEQSIDLAVAEQQIELGDS